MANIILNGKTVVTQTGNDEPLIGGNVVFPAGHIVQVKQQLIEDRTTTAQTGDWQPTGHEIQITTTVNNSKIFFMGNFWGYGGEGLYTLYRNNTTNLSNYNRGFINIGGNVVQTISLMFLDQPNVSSQTTLTYTVYIKARGATTVYIGLDVDATDKMSDQLTLMEIV